MKIVDFNCNVPTEYQDTKVDDFCDEVNDFFKKSETLTRLNNKNANIILNENDPQYLQIIEHNKALEDRVEQVPVSWLSPAVNMIWLSLCSSWRDKFDFNFQRDNNFNNDFHVKRFNDCEYVQKHNLYDWHDFALLKNGVMLYKDLIVATKSKGKLILICDIQYNINDDLQNVRKKSDFRMARHDCHWWEPKVELKYKRIFYNGINYIIKNEQKSTIIDCDTEFLSIDYKSKFTQDSRLLLQNGNEYILNPPLQHDDVANNREFFFCILGLDKYHHTEFTGKHDWDTHGVYWWFGNFDEKIQFSKQATMVMGQIPNCISTCQVTQMCYVMWENIMQYGILYWNGNCFKNVYGMISHQIADMQDRDHLLRRRSNSKLSRNDGKLWLGYEHGSQWPSRCNNLMQLGTITPGPYLLKVWKFLNNDCVQRGLWENGSNIPHNIAKPITLTKNTNDIYNELPIASSLKSTIELNHTTLLGCISQAFKIEWNHIINNDNFNEFQTRQLLRIYLLNNVHLVNGFQCMLIEPKTKITVFNQMHHAWQKLIEIMIALPYIIDWFGNIGLVVALIRWTGAMFNCDTINRKNELQQKSIPLMAEVDAVWKGILSTPKMRGLKQIFIDYDLYHGNKFIDGKTLEDSHQIGKDFQTRHNNFRQSYKISVSKNCFRRLSLLYVMNGGRWGKDWNYCLGKKAMQLKNSKKPNEPHPAILSWLLPDNDEYKMNANNNDSNIEVTTKFSRTAYGNEWWTNILQDEYSNQLVNLLRIAFNEPDEPALNLHDFLQSEWSLIQRIKTFRFHNGSKSFAMNFNHKYKHINANCIVKMKSNTIMKFRYAFEVTYKNQSLFLCNGENWRIINSDNNK